MSGSISSPSSRGIVLSSSIIGCISIRTISIESIVLMMMLIIVVEMVKEEVTIAEKADGGKAVTCRTRNSRFKRKTRKASVSVVCQASVTLAGEGVRRRASRDGRQERREGAESSPGQAH